MKDVRITVMRRTEYPDLMAQFENPLECPCEMTVGQILVSRNAIRPEGLCNEAWRCMESFVKTLAAGGGNFFDGWMKNPYTAMVCCSDGFRPVSYYLEALEQE